MSIKILFSSLCLGLALLLTTADFACAQEEETDPEKVFIYGLNFNSRDGILGGLSFRYLKRRAPKRYHVFAFDLVDVKHPKELRTSNPQTGEFFVPGKSNFLYTFRAMYGRENIFFRKSQEQGVQVHGSICAGPAFGVVAPYIIDYQVSPLQFVREAYDPVRHPNFERIMGTGSLGELLAEGRFVVGGTLKAALTFEYSSIKDNVIGVEAGGLIDVYSEQIEIMPLTENTQIFPTLYLTIFYGISR